MGLGNGFRSVFRPATRISFDSPAIFDELLPIFAKHSLDLLTVYARAVDDDLRSTGLNARSGLMNTQTRLALRGALPFARPAGFVPKSGAARNQQQPGAILRRLLSSLILAIACASQAQPTTITAEETITWIFLNSGAARSKTKSMAPEVVSKMQADHVGNFGQQFDRGTLMAAGPLGDNGFIRGTVILAVQTPEQIADCFKPDPFVQNDILAVEAHPWLVDLMRFGTPKVPFQLARHTLCIVKRGKEWKPSQSDSGADAMLRLFPTLKTDARSGELAISGPFTDAGEKLGLMIFYSTNQARIQTQLEKEPAVVEGRVQVEFHPQFMGKGTLHDPQERLAPPESSKRTRLFDGRSFEGWEGDMNRTWRLEGGALVGGSLTETVPHNDFLCTTREFKNFDLRLKVRLEGTGFVNAGIQFRSRRLKEPAFEMTGYQADMGQGYWGSLYDESRRNKVLAHTHANIVERLVRTGDWNDYIIRCEDGRIRLWLNGVLTVDYTEDNPQIPLSGFIGLQIHGGGKAQASYKDITIEEL